LPDSRIGWDGEDAVATVNVKPGLASKGAGVLLLQLLEKDISRIGKSRNAEP
jgi:hypothetical protein